MTRIRTRIAVVTHMRVNWGPVHTNPLSFENASDFRMRFRRSSTLTRWKTEASENAFQSRDFQPTSTLIRFVWKRIKRFPSTPQQENGVFECIHSRERFGKAPFSPSTLQQENSVFESIHSEERFGKAPFSSVFGDRRRRISVDERPNRIKKFPFENENGLVWTGS